MLIYSDVSCCIRLLGSQILMVFLFMCACTDDDSCVKLQGDGDNESGYINASYIDVRKNTYFLIIITW